MLLLVLRAYLGLIHFDLYLTRQDFALLYHKVRGCPVGRKRGQPDSVARICSAVNVACIWYWKRALCLQRSAVTACFLRRNGIPATLLIGIQQMPFKAHAWVEVDGQVVNDKPYVREVYAVLDRC